MANGYRAAATSQDSVAALPHFIGRFRLHRRLGIGRFFKYPTADEAQASGPQCVRKRPSAAPTSAVRSWRTTIC